MRISGLSSGMDIDAMVKQLMTAQKVPLDKLNQQKQLTEWKREGYRTVSTMLVSLNDKLSTYNKSDAINSKKATVTGASNVTATATGAAVNSVLNISVTSLASSSSVVSSAGEKGATKVSDIKAYAGGDGSITIGTATISFTADESIDSLVKKINSNKDTGVTAVFDTNSGQMSLTNRETGKKDITLSGDLLTKGFGMTKVVEGKDAVVLINGLTTNQSSNNFTINGVNISIKGITPIGETSQIEVSQNVDKMVETIKSFVESYNATIASLNQKTSEERYRTYLPLSNEQKADMKEDEITLWEKKAKSGMLKNDSIIDKALADMRSAMISNVTLPSFTTNAKGEKVYDTINMTQIGITTGSYSEKGKLVIDEAKLRTAIEADPDKVFALFGQTDNTKKTEFTSNDGIFNRIKKIDSVALTSMYEKAGTSQVSSDLTTAFIVSSQMGDQLRAFENRIAEMNRKLTMKETQYYKQFTAMETAMNKYNSVSSSLSSM